MSDEIKILVDACVYAALVFIKVIEWRIKQYVLTKLQQTTGR